MLGRDPIAATPGLDLRPGAKATATDCAFPSPAPLRTWRDSGRALEAAGSPGTRRPPEPQPTPAMGPRKRQTGAPPKGPRCLGPGYEGRSGVRGRRLACPRACAWAAADRAGPLDRVSTRLPAFGTLVYRVLPVRRDLRLMLTGLAERGAGGQGLGPAGAGLAPPLPPAVLAGEDKNLISGRHHGFDLEQNRAAIDDWRAGEGLRGAQHGQHADVQEPVPVARPRLGGKGFGGLPDAFGRRPFWAKRRIMESPT